MKQNLSDMHLVFPSETKKFFFFCNIDFRSQVRHGSSEHRVCHRNFFCGPQCSMWLNYFDKTIAYS